MNRLHCQQCNDNAYSLFRRLKDLFDFTCMIVEKYFQKTQRWSSVYSENRAKTFRRLRHQNRRWRRRRKVFCPILWINWTSPLRLLERFLNNHTVFCCHIKFCKYDFCRWIRLTWSNLLSSPVRQKLFFFWKCTSSWRILTSTPHDPSQKIAIVISTDFRPLFFTSDELRHWLPVISSLNFVFGQLQRPNAPLQTAMDKMHTMDSLLWATDTAKSKKIGSQNVHPAPKMRTKIQENANMHSRVITSKKARTPSSLASGAGFLIAGSHPALCFFPPPFTVVKETWQRVLPVYTSQKQVKIAHVRWQTLAFKHACSLMSCKLQAAHAGLHHLHVDLRKPQGWWLLLSFWG